jgi:hypothetical protein
MVVGWALPVNKSGLINIFLAFVDAVLAFAPPLHEHREEGRISTPYALCNNVEAEL